VSSPQASYCPARQLGPGGSPHVYGETSVALGKEPPLLLWGQCVATGFLNAFGTKFHNGPDQGETGPSETLKITNVTQTVCSPVQWLVKASV